MRPGHPDFSEIHASVVVVVAVCLWWPGHLGDVFGVKPLFAIAGLLGVGSLDWPYWRLNDWLQWVSMHLVSGCTTPSKGSIREKALEAWGSLVSPL